MQETWVWSLGQEDPLEEEMATHSGILSWRTPWKEDPGGLESMDSQRVGHNWATNTFIFMSFTDTYLHELYFSDTRQPKEVQKQIRCWGKCQFSWQPWLKISKVHVYSDSFILVINWLNNKEIVRDFPDSPVVKTVPSNTRGMDSWSGTKIPHASWWGQKKEEEINMKLESKCTSIK